MKKQLQNLAQILRKKSLQLNLFSAGDREKLESKHIPDSLAILDFCEMKGRVLDIGTGGGLPGLALALTSFCTDLTCKSRPGTDFTLMDATQKKIAAVSEMIEELGLENAEAIAGRFEELAHGKLRESFDIVTARAVAELSVLLEYAAGFLDVGGKLYAWKSADYHEELDAAEHAAEVLEMAFVKAYEYEILGAKRVILEFEKIGVLDKKYPRRVGMPKGRPL